VNPAAILDAAHYATLKHHGQKRKGAADVPYVAHVIDVARRLAAARPDDETLILAGLLHDVVEDTDGTREEIAERFGERVAALVMEVTDDKSLPKADRKRLQEEKAASKSEAAKRLKLADKASNLAALAESPPDWSLKRRRAYMDWACRVVDAMRGVDEGLEAAFDDALLQARTALEGSP
jgi:(p)ppGpp synthase/HD superfamily hydrolase